MCLNIEESEEIINFISLSLIEASFMVKIALLLEVKRLLNQSLISYKLHKAVVTEEKRKL